MKGYWSTIDRREGDDWKIRNADPLLTSTPAPAVDEDETRSKKRAPGPQCSRRRILLLLRPSHAVALRARTLMFKGTGHFHH